MRQFYDTFSTPVGDFSVAVSADGSVIATAFGGLAELRERFIPDELTQSSARTSRVRAEVLAYFAGTLRRFTVPLAASGTLFQQQVWAILAKIPFGQTRSYGNVATELGKPDASRAVGRANGTNPICLIVPCHRVIGADGSLTGFAFGEDIKRRLLEHENALPAA